MCGIAGYSLSARSSVDRTLAAQALLAGIAERGADAVGYAYRRGEGTVTIQNPWMDMDTGKLNNDTLISIVKK